MKKLIGILVGAGIVGSWIAAGWATTNTAAKVHGWDHVVYKVTLPSMAQNALDTTVVAVSDADLDGVKKGVIFFVGGSGVDSTNVAIDTGPDNSDWTELYSLNNTATNLTTADGDQTVTLDPALYLRLRVKNPDATTGTGTIWLVLPKRY